MSRWRILILVWIGRSWLLNSPVLVIWWRRIVHIHERNWTCGRFVVWLRRLVCSWPPLVSWVIRGRGFNSRDVKAKHMRHHPSADFLDTAVLWSAFSWQITKRLALQDVRALFAKSIICCSLLAIGALHQWCNVTIHLNFNAIKKIPGSSSTRPCGLG